MAAEQPRPGPHVQPCEWDYTAIPFTDRDTHAIITQAVETLIIYRRQPPSADAGAVVSALVSLIAEADGSLHDAVADARNQGHSWDAIASRLGTTASTAQRRYAAYTRWRAVTDRTDS